VAWETDLARPEQLPDSDTENWSIYLYLAGRGAGKTRTAAEWLAWEATTRANTRWAIVAPTFGDVRDVCAEGESGIVNILNSYGSLLDYNRSQGQIILLNGSRIKLFSADEPDRLRGPQHHGAWCDELAAWRYSDTWDQLQFGLRLGDHPRTIVTTTPRPVALIRALAGRTDGTVKIARGSTFDNAENLAPQALIELQARYAGTRMGRQELYGEILNESDSALWTRDLIESARVKPEDAPPYFRVVVAIDPAVTSGEGSDETGIVVAGATPDGHYYILEDATMRGTPEQWARKAIEMYRKHKCDRIIGEANNGGDMIESLLRQVDSSVAYRKVHASRGKRVRAEPVSALSEQSRLHMVGNNFAELEDQLVTWEPDSDKSPDRMDAMVWAISDLMGGSNSLRSLAALADFCPSCRLPVIKGTRFCPRCNTAVGSK
jgi:predicted phage terminase large subunit-like protein